MNPALGQECHLFANRNSSKNMQLLIKNHTVYTAPLIRFPDDGKIWGQKYRVGDIPPFYHAGTPSKTKTMNTMSLDRAQFFTLGLVSDWCQHSYITIILAIKQVLLIDKAGEKV